MRSTNPWYLLTYLQGTTGTESSCLDEDLSGLPQLPTSMFFGRTATHNSYLLHLSSVSDHSTFLLKMSQRFATDDQAYTWRRIGEFNTKHRATARRWRNSTQSITLLSPADGWLLAWHRRSTWNIPVHSYIIILVVLRLHKKTRPRVHFSVNTQTTHSLVCCVVACKTDPFSVTCMQCAAFIRQQLKQSGICVGCTI